MMTLVNRMAVIAAATVVLGTAAFGQTRPGKTETPPASRTIAFFHLPCWLDLPHHFCRVEPRPLVATAK